MRETFSPVWGPYAGVADARDRLCRFVDKACDPGVGVVWTANGAICPLRAPHRDGAGFGDVVIFEWSRISQAIPRPPSDFWSKVRKLLDDYFAMQGQTAQFQAASYVSLNQTINATVHRALTEHRDDAAGVALDVLCVALSLALLPTGLGALALVGLVGSSFLLATDTVIYGLEISDSEKGAEWVRSHTLLLRILATVMTLPDVAYGGLKIISEMREINELRLIDKATAATATALGGRATNAARADRYMQIAERAHLRTQIRTQQISAMLKLEITPRVAGVGSASLLVREQLIENKEALQKIMEQIKIHVIGVKR